MGVNRSGQRSNSIENGFSSVGANRGRGATQPRRGDGSSLGSMGANSSGQQNSAAQETIAFFTSRGTAMRRLDLSMVTLTKI